MHWSQLPSEEKPRTVWSGWSAPEACSPCFPLGAAGSHLFLSPWSKNWRGSVYASFNCARSLLGDVFAGRKVIPASHPSTILKPSLCPHPASRSLRRNLGPRGGYSDSGTCPRFSLPLPLTWSGSCRGQQRGSEPLLFSRPSQGSVTSVCLLILFSSRFQQ